MKLKGFCIVSLILIVAACFILIYIKPSVAKDLLIIVSTIVGGILGVLRDDK